MRLYVVAKNHFKQEEACQILALLGIAAEPDHIEIHERQTVDSAPTKK